MSHSHASFEGAPKAIRCVSASPLPVIFDNDTRVVLAVIDGRRDIAAIVARRLDDP